MRRCLPDPAEERLDDLYLGVEIPSGGARPHVYLGMVASADGAASVEGRTARLGGAADQMAFSRLRETCDAILVGAGTVRAEDYGPPRTRPGGRERREERGLAPVPTIVVVTGSADLDPGSRLFADPLRRPVVATVVDAPEERRMALSEVADVWQVGDGEVDLAALLQRMAGRGWRRVLCEGGPGLNGRLLRAGLVDELFLTIAPTLVGVSEHRITDGGELPAAPVPLELVELRHHESELLLRYRVAGDPQDVEDH